MSRYRCLGFLTDYGLADGFVAVCHGVILGIVPDARVVDISHVVPAYDVRRGAAVLARASSYLDPAVLLAVVDPGVGGDRRAVALATEASVLVGPDNGLLVDAAERLGGVRRAVELDREELFGRSRSATFDGRDVFAPVAAHLLGGRPIDEVGSPLDPATLVRLARPRTVVHAYGVEAEVVGVDHYGNLQLAASWPDLPVHPGDEVVVRTATTEHRVEVGRQFTSVAPGGLVVYADSDDRVAIAVNGGDAARRLDVAGGATVRILTARARTPDR